MPNTQNFVNFAKELAHEAAKEIMPWFMNAALVVDSKSDQSPVTIADRNAESRMREMIAQQYPNHGVIGEEFGEQRKDAEYVWVLDPIDGTKSFAAGCPLFGTLIALLYRGEPVLGVIHLPALRQLCIGDGKSTYLNDKPVQVRQQNELSRAVLLTTDLENIERYQNGERFRKLMQQTYFTRTWGDCYGYVLVAGGWADIMTDPIMNRWDLLALIPIIRGAGGVITDWQGNDPVTGEIIIAANPVLHPQVLKILNG